MLSGTHSASQDQLDIRRLRTLYQLLDELNQARGLEGAYDAALRGLLAATGADRAAVLMFDEDGVMHFQAWRGVSFEYRLAATGHSPWAKGSLTAESIAVPDVDQDPSLASYGDVLRAEGIRALAFVPLVLDRGVFGKFMLYYADAHEFAPDELAVARVIASLVAQVIERKRAEWELARSEQRLQAILDNSAAEREALKIAEILNSVGPTLAAELDSQRLVQAVTDIATSLVGAEFGAFFHNLLNEKGESFMLYTLSGVAREAFAGFPMPRNTAVFGATFRGEGVVRSDDIKQDPRYGHNAPYRGMPPGHLPVRSYLAAPVVARSGEVLGGLFFGHSQPGRFTARDEAALLGLAAQASIAMDNARLFEQSQWAQDELKRSNEELRRVNQDLETFAYSASHDLQEPLRTISLSAQLLQRTLSDRIDPDSAMFLESVCEGSRRMEHLLRDLLTYTTATKYAEGPAPMVEANEVLAGVLAALQGRIGETGAKVDAGPLPRVSVHESRLAQLFQNLIGNALKYRSKEVPHVQITGSEQDGWCVFSVADNGIGIETRYAEQIFGLFKRLHTRDEYSGSGIGLAICQRIVEQYGGRIWLERSVPGEGSTFSFALPVRSR